MIQFLCDRVVTKDVDRVRPLKIHQAGDGSRGPEEQMEILPGCMISCSVEVTDRKMPLKISLRYERKEGVKSVRRKLSSMRP